jgi:hypothetical protein
MEASAARKLPFYSVLSKSMETASRSVSWPASSANAPAVARAKNAD